MGATVISSEAAVVLLWLACREHGLTPRCSLMHARSLDSIDTSAALQELKQHGLVSEGEHTQYVPSPAAYEKLRRYG